MFASSASAGSHIDCRRIVPDASCLFPGLHPECESSCDRHSFLNNATEKMANPRNSYVVLKPVCTPVPPVPYGYAAGHAGYAPPRIRVVSFDGAHPGSQRQRPLAATKSNRTRGNTRINDGRSDARAYAPIKMNDFCLSLGTPRLRRCPRAARGVVSRRECSVLGLFAVTAHATAWRDARIVGPVDSLASGIGVNSHTPPADRPQRA